MINIQQVCDEDAVLSHFVKGVAEHLGQGRLLSGFVWGQ